MAVLAAAALSVAAVAGPAAAQSPEPDHLRGQIESVDATSVTIRMRDARTVRLALPDDATLISVSRATFADVGFGTYVGAVAQKLSEYPPFLRESRSWLHRAFELRIVDEDLRGIALGYKPWDRPPGSTISHGWVDDIEGRILSIKFGPTDYDETDVDVPEDVPIQRMSTANRRMLKPGAAVFAGARRADGRGYTAVFVIIGTDGIVPAL